MILSVDRVVTQVEGAAGEHNGGPQVAPMSWGGKWG